MAKGFISLSYLIIGFIKKTLAHNQSVFLILYLGLGWRNTATSLGYLSASLGIFER